MGFWTAAQAGRGALGWILGGFLTQGPGWEWVFLSTVPVGILGVLLAPVLLPERSDTSAPPKLDAAGATTVTAALALLVYGLTRAEETGLASPSTLGSLELSAALFVAFVFIEARIRHPLVPLAAARTDSLAGGLAHPPDALVEGYRWAFYAGAALAVLGALTALALIRATAARHGGPSNP